MGSEMPKVEEKIGEDRISQMPNEILVRILSLLYDTLLAVQTTILSKRWNNLWVSISSLRFKYDDFECDDGFMTFVDRVVSLHDSSDIRKFYLDYHIEGAREYMLVDDYSRIQTCISTVVERNVVEFDLTLCNEFNLTPEVPFLFPESLFRCKTLVVLKLHWENSASFSNFPIDACLPRLKVLDIFVYDPREANFPCNLFTSCPVLEDITIDAATQHLDTNISAPELKTLRMRMSMAAGPYGLYSINAPKLETFDLSDDAIFPNKYLFENGTSPINVKLDLDDIDENFFGVADVIALFAKFSNVEYLSLDFHYLDLRDLNDFCLPEFVNLSQLVLVLRGFSYWKFLIECLKRSPNLKHLVLEKKRYSRDDREWIFFDPPELPGCLVSHLQTISMKGFEGERDEMEVAEFLLKNGQVLNTVSIHTVSKGLLHTKENLYKKLLTYKRGSGSCVILAD